MEFRVIKKFPAYEVSRCGVIRSRKTLNHIKAADNGNGYYYVSFIWGYDGGFYRLPNIIRHSVHRLVAFEWVEGEGECVNHKNGIKTDNRAENLEWCSLSDNIRHCYEVIGHKAVGGMRGKKHSMITKEKQSKAKIGEKHPRFSGYYIYEDKKFPSLQELADYIGTYPVKVHRMFKKGLINKL